MKYLFLEHGWTAESFLAAVEARLGYALDPAEPLEPPAQVHRDHLGVIPQKQDGFFSVGAAVIRGRITPEQLTVAADLAERYGDGHVRNTPMQNLLLVNIPEEHVATVTRELSAAGLPIDFVVRARDGSLHGIGVLQAGADGNEIVRAVADGTVGRTLSELSGAAALAHYRVPEFVRAALDCGHRD